ncbi:hypothetical protein [Rothia nasimurium]|uniref:hypothetical protein n=1 Tax=Rothia nasimurium TaxID=85336 RepID=UPI001F39D322|nr:hypothetical protein [Rothia nasimurium]
MTDTTPTPETPETTEPGTPNDATPTPPWGNEENFDPAKVRVSINSTLVHDENGRFYRQDNPKNKRARATILPPFVAQMLMRRRGTEIPAHARTTAWAEPDMFVFPSTTGTLQDPNNFRRKWREQVKGTDYEGRDPSQYPFYRGNVP